MAIKDLLVQIDGSTHATPRLAAAIELAQTYGAHLTGLCLAVEPPIPAEIPRFMPADVLASQRKAVLEQAETAAARFRLKIEAAGVLGECRVVEVQSLEATNVFVRHARHADLAILSQADPEEVSPLGRQFPADVVMSSGRPAIVIPYVGPAATLGRRVLIGWNGSREAARAVNDALPILRLAQSVTVLSVNPDEPSGGERRDPGADISLHLARHGVIVTAAQTIAREIPAADAILNAIADAGFDLLVMGAYGRPRLREMILGGVTQIVLEHMTVPVFMSH
jgi:nucleotide-binding universal stress UspA family protein